MQLRIFEKYIDELIEKSTLNAPAWNIGKAREEYKAEYDNLMKVFVDLIDSMSKCQDESGIWYQLPTQSGRETNYLETSGSAIMAYFLLKGLRLGFLPKSNRAYGLKAFQGICDRAI